MLIPEKINSQMYIGFAVHVAITLLAGIDDEILLFVMLVPLLGNLVGLSILNFTDNIKLGAKIFMISSFFFVPIGLIAIIGARKILDQLKEQEFLKTKQND
jgi:hypothetical protein